MRDATFEPIDCGVTHSYYSAATTANEKFTINNECGVEQYFAFATPFSGIPRLAVGIIYENNKKPSTDQFSFNIKVTNVYSTGF